MKIIVTGGAGFIGSHVCEALLNKNKVICIDDFNDYYSPERKYDNIKGCKEHPNFQIHKANIVDYNKLKSIFETYKPDKVIHLAARAGVRPSIKDPFIYTETNIKGTLNLLELSRIHKVKQFIFGSSSSVYGSTNKVPFSEDQDTDKPVSPYAATKKAGEALCYTYSYLYNLNITCLRFFTVYGPRGRPDMAPYLFTNWIMNNKPIIMFGDGSTKRDYTYISDIVSGILSSLENEFKYEIINLGNSQTVELRRLISTIEKYLGKKAKIIQKDIVRGDVPITYANISKAKKLLNYNPKVSIDDGIAKFIDWIQRSII